MSQTTETALQTACALLERRESGEATEILQQLTATRPSCAPALQTLALVCAMNGANLDRASARRGGKGRCRASKTVPPG